MKKYTAAILCLFFTFCCAAVSAAEKTAFTAVGYAATRPGGPLIPYRFTLPELGGHDMLVEIAYAGVCHSDIHLVNDEHGPSLNIHTSPVMRSSDGSRRSVKM